MSALRISIVLCALAAAVQSVRWQPPFIQQCHKCAAIDDGSGQCESIHSAYCHDGCVTVQGSVDNARAMNEEHRRSLAVYLLENGLLPGGQAGPYYDDQPQAPYDPSVYGWDLDSQLVGKQVVVRACAHELGMGKGTRGCEEGVTKAGIRGTFCHCIDQYCNRHDTKLLTEMLDEQGSFKRE